MFKIRTFLAGVTHDFNHQLEELIRLSDQRNAEKRMWENSNYAHVLDCPLRFVAVLVTLDEDGAHLLLEASTSEASFDGAQNNFPRDNMKSS